MGKRRKFTNEFKLEAVRLAERGAVPSCEGTAPIRGSQRTSEWPQNSGYGPSPGMRPTRSDGRPAHTQTAPRQRSPSHRRTGARPFRSTPMSYRTARPSLFDKRSGPHARGRTGRSAARSCKSNDSRPATLGKAEVCLAVYQCSPGM